MIAHEVISHDTTVYVRSDWASGTTQTSPRLVGLVHAGRVDVAIARTGSFGRGFRGVIGLGVEHIETGTDHLMFLFALLLVAPVAAVSGKWSQRRRTPHALLALARAVTAFTIGHSLTLALGTVGGVTLPATLVEAGIALSILILARTRAYDWFRIAGASAAAVLSVAWLAERTLNVANPFARPLAWLEAHPLQLLIALAVGALTVRAAERRLPKATVSASR